MRRNRRRIPIIITILAMVLSALSAIRHTSAINWNPDQTILEVKQPGAQAQWGTTRTIHALQLVTFRWKTDVPNTDYVEWQMLDYKPQPNGMGETPFATRKLKKMPAPDFQEFTIDFAHQQQQMRCLLVATRRGLDPQIDADDGLHAFGAAGGVELDGTEQVAQIGDRQRRLAIGARGAHRIAHTQRAVDDRVFGVRAQMDEVHGGRL